MPRDITVTFEDGATHVYRGAPDNVTPDQVSARAAKEFGKSVKALDGGRASYSDASPGAQPAAVKTGSLLREIPRQLGLTARYGIEALGNVAEIGTEPIRQLAVNPLLRAAGLGGAQRTGAAATAFANLIGLPSPQNADERVIGDAARLVGGAAAMGGAAGQVAQRVASPVTQAVATKMASAPVIQGVGAASAGIAGGSVREAGGGPAEQFVASLVGGLAGGVGAAKLTDAAKRGASTVAALSRPRQELIVQAEGQLELAAQRAGIDWKNVADGTRNAMRQEVADALRTGRPLNEDALRRLVAFRNTGTEPTVGMLTQDPIRITREQNLARIGANSDDQLLQKLPMLQNRNAAQLLRRLDQAGADGAPDLMESGRRAVDSLRAVEGAAKSRIDGLYQAARDSSGRSLPLEGGTFTRRAGELLDAENVGSFLPTDIRNKLNAIAQGSPGFEFNVSSAEQLKTSIGNLQRGAADGNVRRALGLVRQALDEAPLQNSARVNPQGLPVAPGAVPPSTQAGEQAILAFNKARAANREWMQRVESTPALKAVVDGVEPDQFVQKFVIGKSAPTADVQRLADSLDQSSRQALKQALVKHLRDAATSSTDDVTKFTQAGYRAALRNLGDEKLSVFFTPQERQLLRDIGDAAKLMQSQPVGSAVNNSNSGALVAARGMDLLDRLAGFAPLGIKDVIRGKITQPMLQRQALDPRNALLEAARIERTPVTINPLLAAVMPVQASQDY